MDCPFCKNSKTKVISVVSFLETENPRIRECCSCHRVFRTVERIDPEIKLIVATLRREGVLCEKEAHRQPA